MDNKVKAALLAGGVVAISMTSSVFAAATAVTSAATAQTVSVASSAAGGYVAEAFKLNVSANVAMSYDGDTTAVGVKSGNSKGMHTFGGSSNGGAVKACESTSIANPAASLTATITAGC
ncbi:hypothetical protein R0381_001152 [Jeongeupia wiesaeckerbachi]|uniref:hypothetical protein n=1 Tax=Jeongeupia wiesaeckerbachi TaxID=3051218 RepID=UPI003D80738B